MTDYFTLLNEPRGPWLNEEALKTKFLQLSAEFHPDRFHTASESDKELANQKFAELNRAFNCLVDPKERLLHLLMLETGEKPRDVQRIPPGTMDFFMEVGQLCHKIEAFTQARQKETSPLLKVKYLHQGMELVDQLHALSQKIHAKRLELLHELQSINPLWAQAPQESTSRRAFLPLDKIEHIYRILSYISRWMAQLKEQSVQLEIG